MAIITKKDEKAERVLDAMQDTSDELEFKNKFKEMYPDDWDKINKTYIIEERKTKPGKNHPMPKPDTYLHNMYSVALGKHGGA